MHRNRKLIAKKRKKSISNHHYILGGSILFIVGAAIIGSALWYHCNGYEPSHKQTAVERRAASTSTKSSKNPAAPFTDHDDIKNHPVNYKRSSLWRSYPKLQKDDRIIVSLKDQRAYVQRPIKILYRFRGKNSKEPSHEIYGNSHKFQTIYMMFVSTGSHNRTPRGVFHINNVRTKWFYSNNEHEGAQYGTGFHDGGVYLFHSTPANRNHKIFKHVARQLGKKPSSHGCVHLTIPDAKWIYSEAKPGMKVIIVPDIHRSSLSQKI